MWHFCVLVICRTWAVRLYFQQFIQSSFSALYWLLQMSMVFCFFFKEPLWKPLMELCRPLENRICSLRASLLRMTMRRLTYVALCCILILYSLVCWVCFTHGCWVPLICWAVFNLQAHLTHPFRFHPSVFLWNTWCLRKNPYWFGGFVCVFCFCFPAPDIKGVL